MAFLQHNYKIKGNMKIIFSIFLILFLLPSSVYAEEIPEWIKTITEWWVKGEVTDGEFIDAMEYIFEKNLIYSNPNIENDFLRTIALSEIQQKVRLFETSLNLRVNLTEFLSEMAEIQMVITSESEEEELQFKDKIIKNEILNRFQKFIESDNSIDQIRILNLSGMEIIRMNNVNDNLSLVPDYLLQDKSNRDYFTEIINMEQNDIYVSKINLNEEFGQVEVPLNPTIRIGTIIQDNKNTPIGILIVNYRLGEFLSGLSQSNICDIVIIDQDGTAIKHYDERKEFGSQLGTNYSYFDEHREIELGKIKDLNWYHDRLNQMTIIKQKMNIEDSENQWEIVCELK